MLIPWGFTSTLPDSYLDLQLLAFEGVLEILVTSGEKYDPHNVAPYFLVNRGLTLTHLQLEM